MNNTQFVILVIMLGALIGLTAYGFTWIISRMLKYEEEIYKNENK